MAYLSAGKCQVNKNVFIKKKAFSLPFAECKRFRRACGRGVWVVSDYIIIISFCQYESVFIIL